MPNCKEHDDCDLVCSECGSYYCQSDSHEAFYWEHTRDYVARGGNAALAYLQSTPRAEVPFDDMPDDPEAYRNERAEEMP